MSASIPRLGLSIGVVGVASVGPRGKSILAPNLLETVQQMSKFDCPCAQCFWGEEAGLYECYEFSSAELAETSQWLVDHQKTLYVHCPVNVNLAKKDETDKMTLASMRILKKEFRQICRMPACGVVHMGTQGTVQMIAERINTLVETGNVIRSNFAGVRHHFLLENSAGEGSKLGRNWDELRQLAEGLDKSVAGLLLDTQHAYGAGMIQWDTPESVISAFETADDIFPGGICAIHLNDCDTSIKFGARKDRHEVVGQGNIWKDSTESLGELMKICGERNIDIISETSDGQQDRVVSLAAWQRRVKV